jgi:hypothetical protein
MMIGWLVSNEIRNPFEKPRTGGPYLLWASRGSAGLLSSWYKTAEMNAEAEALMDVCGVVVSGARVL